MRQRVGETDEDYRDRRAAYDQARRGKWQKHRRTLNKNGAVTSTTQKRARDPETAVKIPAGLVSRTSTLYDADGNVAQQWVQEKPEDKAKVELWQHFANALAEKLPRYEPTIPPVTRRNEDLLVGYPIGDHHMGMLSWSKETGASYDLEIGEKLLTKAFDYLTAGAPPAGTALIAVLGDFFHYDSMEPVTPTSRNLLDADGRFPKMVMAGVRTIRSAISAALRHHNQVRVIVEVGNHDLSTSHFLAILLLNVYENEPRVSIDISPKHYHYFVFGNNVIGTHHGHGTKLEALPLTMAIDQPEAWAVCKHRFWWTGHVHKFQQQNIQGVWVESFGILPPPDAWAANKGYRTGRGMDAIVFHKKNGRLSRNSLTPEMLED